MSDVGSFRTAISSPRPSEGIERDNNQSPVTILSSGTFTCRDDPQEDVVAKYLKYKQDNVVLTPNMAMPVRARRVSRTGSFSSAKFHSTFSSGEGGSGSLNIEKCFESAFQALQQIDKERGIPLPLTAYSKLILATHEALSALAMCSTEEALTSGEFYANQLHNNVQVAIFRREKSLIQKGSQAAVYAMSNYSPQSAEEALANLVHLYRGAMGVH